MPFAAEGDDLGLRTLWTDGANASRRLASKAKAGGWTPLERKNLKHFIDHGWLVMPAAIEPRLIDAFVSDVRRHHESPGLFVKTDHRRGSSKLKTSDAVPDAFESLFDLYVNFESSRRVCLNPTITRFLSLVFDDGVTAFQQLLFQRSNGHQVHSDTAFVAVEDPCLLAATWIALEDVVEGSGELSFYDKSHKLPHYLFADGTKRSNPAADDLGAYPGILEAECVRRDFKYERFLARKGDVFFWAADLIHRSHPKSLPDATSRMSAVTHYCPASTTPFWFRFHPDKRSVEPYGDSVGFASSYYVLPTRGRKLAPSGPF